MMGKLTDIMLVEDESDIREVVSIALVDLGGFKLTICESGQQAIDEIVSANPQLILLDAMMPNMDGLTTFKKLKESPAGKDVPIIFMTARIQSSEIEEYEKLGAIGVIAKPFDPILLSAEVNRLWHLYESNLH